MPTITNIGVIPAIATAYIANNLDKGAGLRAAGYTDSYSKSAKGLRLYDRSDLKAGIKAARLALVAKTGFTKAEAHIELDENRKLAIEMKQAAAATSTTTAKMRLYGYDQPDAKKDSTVIIINPPTRPRIVPSQAAEGSCEAIEAELE